MSKGKYHDWITPEGLIKIEGWAKDGLTDKQIAEDKIGITERAFTGWKSRFPELVEALKQGKEVADCLVENALYKRAVGYRYEEVTYENDKEIKRVVKEALPDVTAQIFWLKNRKPEEWRDKQNIYVAGLSAEQSKLSELLEQRKARRQVAAKK